MNNKSYLIAGGALVALIIIAGTVIVSRSRNGSSQRPTPTPSSEETLNQLSSDKYPKVGLTFKSDGHYVTVNISNLYASRVEYNLIYDADVKVQGKVNRIQTGVTGDIKLDGKSQISQEQLLGTTSSGKYSYHENIDNALLEVTLRDDAGRSIYTATYPFTYSPGKTLDLQVE